MDDRVVLHLDAVVKHLLPDNVAWKQILLKFWEIVGHYELSVSVILSLQKVANKIENQELKEGNITNSLISCY